MITQEKIGTIAKVLLAIFIVVILLGHQYNIQNLQAKAEEKNLQQEQQIGELRAQLSNTIGYTRIVAAYAEALSKDMCDGISCKNLENFKAELDNFIKTQQTTTNAKGGV